MPAASTVVIALKWPGRCFTCGRALPSGERARWDRARHRATCLDCLAREDADHGRVEAGIAGASAMREYERRHDARLRRARERFGPLGEGVARISGDPSSTRVWRKGAEGEAKVAKQLEKALAGREVQLLHDRLLPGSRRANIDHLAIGPGGVTVIDAKNLHGKVRVETIGGLFSARQTLLRVNGRNRTKLVQSALRQAEAVRELLRQAELTAELTVDVRAALCFASTEGLPLLRRLEVDSVPIGGPRRVADLAARPGTLTPEQRERICRELAGRLPAA